MRGAARSRDDDFNAALFSRGGVFKKKIGRAMRGDNACFMRNTEFAERFGGELHGVPIRAGAHDDADEGVSSVVDLLASAIEFLGLLARHGHPSCKRKNAG